MQIYIRIVVNIKVFLYIVTKLLWTQEVKRHFLGKHKPSAVDNFLKVKGQGQR